MWKTGKREPEHNGIHKGKWTKRRARGREQRKPEKPSTTDSSAEVPISPSGLISEYRVFSQKSVGYRNHKFLIMAQWGLNVRRDFR